MNKKSKMITSALIMGVMSTTTLPSMVFADTEPINVISNVQNSNTMVDGTKVGTETIVREGTTYVYDKYQGEVSITKKSGLLNSQKDVLGQTIFYKQGGYSGILTEDSVNFQPVTIQNKLNSEVTENVDGVYTSKSSVPVKTQVDFTYKMPDGTIQTITQTPVKTDIIPTGKKIITEQKTNTTNYTSTSSDKTYVVQNNLGIFYRTIKGKLTDEKPIVSNTPYKDVNNKIDSSYKLIDAVWNGDIKTNTVTDKLSGKTVTTYTRSVKLIYQKTSYGLTYKVNYRGNYIYNSTKYIESATYKGTVTKKVLVDSYTEEQANFNVTNVPLTSNTDSTTNTVTYLITTSDGDQVVIGKDVDLQSFVGKSVDVTGYTLFRTHRDGTIEKIVYITNCTETQPAITTPTDTTNTDTTTGDTTTPIV